MNTTDTLENMNTLLAALEIPASKSASREFNIALSTALSNLRPREQEVIVRLYGLDGHEPETYNSIANTLGVSRDRVAQTHDGALDRLRQELL
jgi:RNA polymerase sigma factor (sigma-70 family)